MLSPRDITEKTPKVLSLTGKTDNQMIRKACENCSHYSMSGLIATLWEIKKKKKVPKLYNVGYTGFHSTDT